MISAKLDQSKYGIIKKKLNTLTRLNLKMRLIISAISKINTNKANIIL